MGETTGNSEHGGRVIWTREVDHDAIAKRRQNLGRYFGAPSAIALVAALIFGGFGAFLGVLILVGMFGLLVGGLVFFKNFNARMNHTIELVGDELVMGQRRVDLTRVEAWSTTASEEDWGVSNMALGGNPMAGNAITAQVSFRLAVFDDAGQRAAGPGGAPAYDVVTLAWPEMPPDHLQRLQATLEPHIDAPLVGSGELRG